MLNFFEGALCLFEGEFAGQPFLLEPFQQFILGNLFGWYGADGYRRFRTAYIEMGKGNGKSPLAAGVGLYGLIEDDEPAAQIFCAAVTAKQADIIFQDATRMVEASPELRDMVLRNAANLAVLDSGSFFRPVSSERRSLDGKRVHMALIDELHEHPTPMVVDKMRAGTKARRQALIFEITNSGYDRRSVCWNHHVYSQRILERAITDGADAWFAYVCTLDKGDVWKDEKVWKKANPGLGTILPEKYLREQVAEAVGMPSKENIVRRLNFCEWTEQSVRWLPMDKWDACRPRRSLEDLEGAACYGGLDLASTSDFCAFVLLFPEEGTKDVDLFAWFWLPSDAKHPKRSEADQLAVEEWSRADLIEFTPGDVTDYDYIEERIVEAHGRFRIKSIGFDKKFATQLVTHLQEQGLDMIDVPQTLPELTAPSQEFEARIRLGAIRHGNNPVMRWMASNAAAKSDASGEAIRPDKAASGEKIDGITASVIAMRVLLAPEDEQPGPSIYGDAERRPHGLLTI